MACNFENDFRIILVVFVWYYCDSRIVECIMNGTQFLYKEDEKSWIIIIKTDALSYIEVSC